MQVPINTLLMGLGEIALGQSFRGFRLTWKEKVPNRVVFTLVVDAPQRAAEEAVVFQLQSRPTTASAGRLAACHGFGRE